MVASNARKNFGFLHISFYKVVQIVLPIIIVLATPDDMGYAKKDGEEYKKSRVRQNVVLEMGMLLSKLGRKRVAILLKEDKDFEKPSDIAGLIYIPFKDNVEDAKVSLAKEMEENGYTIAVKNL